MQACRILYLSRKIKSGAIYVVPVHRFLTNQYYHEKYTFAGGFNNRFCGL